MFPEIDLANIASYTDEELAAFLSELEALPEAIDLSNPSDEDMATLAAAADAADAIRAEQTQRAEQAEARSAEAQAILDRLRPPAPAEEAPAEEVPAEEAPEVVEAELVPVAAAATRPPAVRTPAVPRRPSAAVVAAAQPAGRRGTPAPNVPRAVITAGADIPGFQFGARMTDREQINQALVARSSDLGIASGVDNEKVVVASIRTEYPEDRQLSGRLSEGGTWERIRAVTAAMERADMDQRLAMTAAGGLCAPVESYYDVLNLAVDAQPVGDNLADFGADRGGIRFVPPPLFSATSGAVGTITAAADATGGAGAVKACLNVACDPITEVDVIAAYFCIEFNNFSARTYPERVDALTSDTAAQHARLIETVRLNAFSAASTQVTATTPFSSSRDFFSRLAQAAAAYRNRNRMNPDAVLDLYAPAWTIDLLWADAVRSLTDDPWGLNLLRSDIEARLRALGINVTWYLDSAAGKGQLFGTQGAGALNAWPTNQTLYLHAPGSFINLDGGELNIGLVRDSALTMGSGTTAGNRFRIFNEAFVNVAYVGREALEIQLPVDTTGAYANTVTTDAGAAAVQA